MPNWKKVVTSGSNAHLNHITASGNISSSGDIVATGTFVNGLTDVVGRHKLHGTILCDEVQGIGALGGLVLSSNSTQNILFNEGTSTVAKYDGGDNEWSFHQPINLGAAGGATKLTMDLNGNVSGSTTSTGSFGNLEINGVTEALLEVQGKINQLTTSTSSLGRVEATTLQATTGDLFGSASIFNLYNDGTAPSELRLNCEANSHYIGIRGPEHSGASSYVLKLPNGEPSDNQILKVNGSPSGGEVTLAWESDGGGGGGVSFPTTEVVSSSNALFIGKTDAPYISGSSGNLELSGSGAVGQLEVDHRFFDTGSTSVSSAGGAIGDTIKFGDSSGLTAGKVYYLESDGTWDDVDADEGGKTSGSIEVATSAAATNGMVLRGVVKLSHDPGGAIGAPLFISTTAGQLTSTAPGSGDFVRIVGYNLDESGLIFFNPGDTTIKVS